MRHILGVVVAAAALAAGCGGGEAEAPPIAETPAPAEALPTSNCAPGDTTCAPAGGDTSDVGVQGIQDAPTGQAPSKVNSLSELDGEGDDIFAPLKALGTPEAEENVFGEGVDGLDPCKSDSLGSAPDEYGSFFEDLTNDACADPGLVDPEESKPKVTYVEAVIAVNGKRYTVAKGGRFPKDDKMFTLDSLSASSVVIRLTAGEFTTGNDGITLEKGRTVVLANQSEATEYEITLVKVRSEEQMTSTIPLTFY